MQEQLEKNSDTEQIVINGLEFAVVKALIEFMYCGETNILEEHLKQLIAAAKFFQMKGIQSMAQDKNHFNVTEDLILIPPPTFLSKKPKYSNTYLPFNNPNVSNSMEQRPLPPTDPAYHRRIKRKYMRTEAEKACAKEAAASRLALEVLQKELANTSQVSSFVIEDSCTETTVENFIPHSEDTYLENLSHLEAVPLHVVNYTELNPSVLATGQIINQPPKNSILHYGSEAEKQVTSVEKLKHMLGEDIPTNVEIMFKTSEGNFVNVTEEVLENITRGSLQYQVIDENGHAGEVQEIRMGEKHSLIEQKNNIFDSNENVPEEIEKPDRSVFVPVSNGNQIESFQSDDYEGMIQECTNQEDFPTEAFIKHSNLIQKQMKMNEKEASLAGGRYEDYEDSSNVYLTPDCDPLSEACCIAEKDESDKITNSIGKIEENYVNLDNNLLNPSEMYVEDSENDCKLPLKKYKTDSGFLSLEEQSFSEEKPHLEFSPRKTRSFKHLGLDGGEDFNKENRDVKFFDAGNGEKGKKMVTLKKKK